MLGEYPHNLDQMCDTRKSLIEIHTMLPIGEQKITANALYISKTTLLTSNPFPTSITKHVCELVLLKQQGLLTKICVRQPALPRGGEEHTAGGGSQSAAEGFTHVTCCDP